MADTGAGLPALIDDRPENRRAEAVRDGNGKIIKGHTLNPGGRPKAWAEFREAMRDRSPKAVKIIDEALRSDDPEERWRAATLVIQYAWGKAPTRLHLAGDDEAPPVKTHAEVDFTKLSVDQLTMLVEMGRALQETDGE